MGAWIRKHYKKYMISPVITLTVVRVVIAVTAALLWHRFINRDGLRGLDQATGIFGLFLLALAWFSYLGTDGVDGPAGMWRAHRKQREKKKEAGRSAGGDMSDYVDEEVVSYSELEEHEKKYCRLAANILSGLLMELLTIILMLIR